MKYGVIDTEDGTWLGNDSGPKLFDDYAIARVAAQVYEMQVFGSDLVCRFQAREFSEKSLRKKDALKARCDTLTALRRVEGSA